MIQNSGPMDYIRHSNSLNDREGTLPFIKKVVPIANFLQKKLVFASNFTMLIFYQDKTGFLLMRKLCKTFVHRNPNYPSEEELVGYSSKIQFCSVCCIVLDILKT